MWSHSGRYAGVGRRRPLAVMVALLGAVLAFLAVFRGAQAAFVDGPVVSVSLDTSALAASPAWTPLATIAINETAPDDLPAGVSDGTLVLRAPSGWEFRDGAGQVFAAVFGGDITADGIVVTAAQITITLTTDDVADAFDFILVAAVEVRPTTSTPSTGALHRPSGADGGTVVVAGITAAASADGAGGTVFASLTAVPGAPSVLRVQPLDANSGAGVATGGLIAGQAFAVRVDAVDQFGNPTAVAGDATVAFSTSARDAPDGTAPAIPATAIATFVTGAAVVPDFVLASAEVGVTIAATVTEPGGTGIVPGAAGASGAVTVSAGPLADFVIERAGGGPIGSVDANVSFPIQVTARDGYQNVSASGPNGFSGADGTVVLSASVAGSAGLGTTPAFAAGVLGDHAVTLSEPASAATLTATYAGALGAATGSSAPFAVESAAPPVLTVPPQLTVIAEFPSGTANPDRLGLITAFLASATAFDAVDGSPLPVTADAPSHFPPGTTVVEFSATDARGGVTAAAVPVVVMSVEDALAGLDARVVALDLWWRLERELREELWAASRAVRRDRLWTAISELDDFIDEVRDERGRRIARADADALIADAERVMDVLRLRRYGGGGDD